MTPAPQQSPGGGRKEGCDLLVRGAAEVVTVGEGAPRLRGDLDRLEVLAGAAVAITDGRIAAIGPEAELLARFAPRSTLDAAGGSILPGFVDAHTHPVFARTRENEFDQRFRGRTYQEITAAGGGIFSSVRSLRSCGTAELAARVRGHFDDFLRHGTTTIEAKSGYGLNVADELRSLETLAAVGADHPLEVVPTFLGAHQMAEEFRAARADYVRLLVDEAIPRVAERRLAAACDVFCDDGAFTLDEARSVLEAARRHGLHLRVHADELANLGATELAAELGAQSADHLCRISPAGIEALARARTAGVLLPATVLSLGVKAVPPARAMVDAGVPVVVATDFNPGTSFTVSMPLCIALAVTLCKLTVAEALVAATLNAAWSLGRHDTVGSLAPGKQADLVVLDRPSYLFLGYELGASPLRAVIKRGRIVWSQP